MSIKSRLAALSCLLVFLLACAPTPATPAAPGGAAEAPKAKIRFGFTSAADFSHVPILMALDALKQQGYDAEPVFFAQSETSLEAVTKNEVQLGAAGAEVLNAKQKGAKLKVIGERNNNEFIVDAVTSIKQCQDLDGKRLAIHSTGSGQTIQLNRWLKDKCPNAKPNILVIAGGENRASAMLAGQLDATPLQMADGVRVESDPRFHRLVNFASELPNLISAFIYVNDDFLAANRPAVKAFLKEQVLANRKVMADPQVFQEMESKYVPQIDANLLPTMIKAYQEINGFDLNGGLTPERVKYTVDFTVEAGGLQPGLRVEDVSDFSILNEVIQEIGRK